MVEIAHFYFAMWPRILVHAKHTSMVVLLSLLFAVLFSLLFLLPLLVSPLLKRAIQPFLVFAGAVPTFILTPLMVLILGFSIWSIVLPTACMLAIPLTLAFLRGLDETPEELLFFYRLHSLPRLYTFLYVELPHAFPSFLAGFRNASSSGVLSVLAAEWVGGAGGLGVFLQELRRNFDLAGVFALTLVIALGSCLFFYGILWLEKRLLSYFSR